MFFAAVVRLLIVFAVCLLVYVALLTWTRNARRRELEEKFAAGDGEGFTREEFIADGMDAYERSFDRKLLYGVFVLPMIVAISLSFLAH